MKATFVIVCVSLGMVCALGLTVGLIADSFRRARELERKRECPDGAGGSRTRDASREEVGR